MTLPDNRPFSSTNSMLKTTIRSQSVIGLCFGYEHNVFYRRLWLRNHAVPHASVFHFHRTFLLLEEIYEV